MTIFVPNFKEFGEVGLTHLDDLAWNDPIGTNYSVCSVHSTLFNVSIMAVCGLFDCVSLSYSTVVLYIGIMKVWIFWPKIISPKPG